MANLNYARATIGGRLTAEPELRTSNTGNTPSYVCRFSVAVSTSPEKSSFFSCVAFGSTAEHIARYFHKGSTILMDTRIEEQQFTDNNNQTRRTINFIVERTFFVDSKAESPSVDVLTPKQFNEQIANAKTLPETPAKSLPSTPAPTASAVPMQELKQENPSAVVPEEYASPLSSNQEDTLYEELSSEEYDDELPF